MIRGIIISVVCIFLLLALSVGCSKERQEQVIKGVWIPDPSHTSLLHSYDNIVNGVKFLKESGINTLFLCVYTGDKVGFKSKVYERVTGSPYNNYYMFSKYDRSSEQATKASSRDPVMDLINISLQSNIKVVFWFEFGFMATIGGETPASHNLVRNNPDWITYGNNQIQANYNGTDFYINGFNPQVQDFLLDLICESLLIYKDAAGIQGDDRLPAMPANSGYDIGTIKEFSLSHNGSLPPDNYRETEWYEWRVNILNRFAERMYKRVKSLGKNYMVCHSPNPYPWCKENLMQDTDYWLKSGITDLLTVQMYRLSGESYKHTLDETLTLVNRYGKKEILNPGMLLKAPGINISWRVFEEQLKINREAGIKGETLFYIEGLYNDSIQEVLIIHNSLQSPL